MNSDNLVAIIAIVAPFLFAAWVIKAGIRAKERKHGASTQKENERRQSDRELEDGIMDLAKRIENLEIILRNRNNNKE
ncbi:MAG: hypothetical protein VB025_06375 [Sphaerochaeta sp.]|jgi:hypothetical protein|nr:hypothetical protein [Sphaerochaeta sp.]PKL28233.1 MAG: hypothetical protein CVV46_07770 [Spirochaetae bacterium HGW-Spirochaetae-2]